MHPDPHPSYYEGMLSDSKECTVCGLRLPPDQYYTRKGAPDGLRTSCKKCHVAAAVRSQRRARLKKALKGKTPDRTMVMQRNKLALQVLGACFDATKGVMYCPTQIQGVIFPNPQGLEVTMGVLAPVVIIQTSRKRIRMSLGMSTPDDIAMELDRWGIEILWVGLPTLPEGHPLERELMRGSLGGV